MRILCIAKTWWPEERVGGPVLATKRLTDELAKQGHEVLVWTPHQTIRSPGAVDVVHLTGVYLWFTWIVLLLCRWRRVPLVWSPRGSWQRWKGSRKVRIKHAFDWICRRLAPAWTVIHATSDAEAAEIATRFPWPIRVVPNGVDAPASIHRVPSVGQLRLLYLGRLDPKKGVEHLIHACRCYPWLSLRLRIAGDGDSRYVSALRSLADGDARIAFMGWVPRAQHEDLFANSDLLVLPSYTENFAQVVGEALAHGVPVAATSRVPWPLVTEDCGLEYGADPAATAWLIPFLLACDIEAMGKRGRAWILRECRWEDRASDMIATYEFAVSRVAAATSPN